jgi:hypothetical protein
LFWWSRSPPKHALSLNKTVERTLWCIEGGWIGSLQFLKQKQRIKTPVGTTDVVPVLTTGSVLPVPGRYYRQAEMT